MRKTKAVVIAALAIIVGVGLVYSPLLLYQTQVVPLASDRDTGSTVGFLALYNTLKAGEATTMGAGDKITAAATGLASISEGLVAAIAIGLVSAATCYFIIKRKVVDKNMLNESSP